MALCLYSTNANAIDPVSGALSSGAASGVLGKAFPMATNGTANLVKGTFGIVKDALGVVWLPVGAVESTVGAPFGLFGHGLTNMADGIAAPFKVVGGVAKLPFQVMGSK